MKLATLKLQREILSQEQQQLLNGLEDQFVGYVLGGGTALSMQIKHRMSFDFDFFSPEMIPRDLLVKIKEIIPINRVARDTSDELTFYTGDKGDIKITALHYPFDEVFKNIATDGNLRYFPLAIIAAQKAYAVGRRGAYRDYYDLFAILNQKYLTIGEVIKMTEKIFGSIFNPKIFLEQLVYFDDLTDFEILAVDKDQKIVDKNEVERFFQLLVTKFLKNFI